MRVGDLVKAHGGDFNFEVGVIVSQIGCVDRWLVYWLADGYKQGYNGCNLELL